MLRTLSSAFRFTIENSLLLVAGAAAALVWANLDPTSYERATHQLHFVVNDVGMAFFFALAAKEVFEATLPGGALESPRRAAVPLIAAAGGMVGPATVYAALVVWSGELELLRGWAIPCATDIAFSYLVARMIFGDKHPAIPFLLLLAIADDALGLVILALVYPTGEIALLPFAAILAAAVAFAWWLGRAGVRSFWPYVVGAGSLSWLAFYRGGFHPALALVPIVPFIPHGRRDPGLFHGEAALGHDALTQFEHRWQVPVQAILFFFGLVNAGVPLASAGPGTWIVLAAILVGKPVGIVGSTMAAVGFGLHVPRGIGWKELVIVGMAAAIGFTVALFFATAAFSQGPLLEQAKMGALLSFGASALSALLAAVLRAGRFRRSRRGEKD